MYTEQQTTVLTGILIVYFAFLVGFAYMVNRRVKTYEDYSVAGRTVGLFPMILTLVGTAIGGSILLGYMTNGYTLGVGQIWLGLVMVPTTLVIILCMTGPIRRLGVKHHMVTMGDFTSLIYGEKARIPTAISMLFAYCAITGMQFVSIATILYLTLEMSMTWGITIAWIMLTIKTVLGGLKSVVFQDALHGTIQTLGIFVLFVVVILAAGGWETIEANATAAGEEQMLDFLGIAPGMLGVYILTIGAYQMVRQDLWQRIWAARTMRVLKIGLWTAIILQTLICTVVVLIGMMTRWGLELDVPDPSQVYYAVIGEVFPFPMIVVMIIAVLATVISCADSFFLAASSTLVNDVIRPRMKNPTSDSLLKWSKISVLITSVIAFLLAQYIPQLVVLWVTGTAMLVSGLLAPVLLGMFWRRVTRPAGIAAMWSGLVAAVIWQLAGEPLGWHPVFVGLPLNLVVLVVGSLMTQRPLDRDRSWAAESRDIPEEDYAPEDEPDVVGSGAGTAAGDGR
ncbi:sodium:solute symporter family protein [Nesterenkonia aerolata]|uniref:Sodium:solute symporter family protein n=1 Tax=Nesterenkonia aerolata TaxID=3074079 RepID=A0ABU2DS22_9MICC|nr:sodium:solute symporter family protein [Nesterenkonia sp. LY-0111]MDR8019288.1 sodium:solute symporter family protein [Nesterenkonia sp. LY-0111]